MAKHKKTKRRFSVRLQSGWAGGPTDDFRRFRNHARTELDRKEIVKTLKDHIQQNFSAERAAVMRAAPDWQFDVLHHIAASIEWLKLGNVFPEQWNGDQAITDAMQQLYDAGAKAIKAKSADDTPAVAKRACTKKSPSQYVKEATVEAISDIESALDSWFQEIPDSNQLHVYEDLKSTGAAYKTAKAIADYYRPILEEAQQIVAAKRGTDLYEAYVHWDKSRKQQYVAMLTSIVEDALKYAQTKLAIRKPRKSRGKAADKQIAKLSYMKESAELKLVSINPITIIGAMRLYTYNPRTRTLAELVCRSAKGFEIKGTTLQNVDEQQSKQSRVKPEFLSTVLEQTPRQIAAVWNKIGTKTTQPTARLTSGTILLRVVNK